MPKIELLLFLCQGKFLKECGKPLFAEDFIASPCGPVLPTLHKTYKRSSDVSAAPFFSNANISYPLSEEEKGVIESVLWEYADLKVSELMDLVREKWAKARKGDAFISKEHIRDIDI